jgi:hypothetical protein
MEAKDLNVIKDYLLSINIPKNIVDNINNRVFDKVLVKSLSSVNVQDSNKRSRNKETNVVGSNQAHLDYAKGVSKFFNIVDSESKDIYIDLLLNNTEHLKAIDNNPIDGGEYTEKNTLYIPKIRGEYSKEITESFAYVSSKAEVHIGRQGTGNQQTEVRTPNENEEIYKLRRSLYFKDCIVFLRYKDICDRYLVIGLPSEEFSSKSTLFEKRGNKVYSLEVNEKLDARNNKKLYKVKYSNENISENILLNMTEVPYKIVEHYIDNNDNTFEELKDKFRECKCGNKDLILEIDKKNTVRESDYFRPKVRPNLNIDSIEFGVNTQWYGNGAKDNFTKFIEDVSKLGYQIEVSNDDVDEELYKVKYAVNKMYFGAPGTGKSNKVNEDYYNERAKRVTFHPEYTYNDFVGCIMPVVDDNDLTYRFVPGIFTEILTEALSDPYYMHTLIIEELNRANTAAVFGDLFQLLDRKLGGSSEYRVNNTSIYKYIKDSLGNDYIHNDGSIGIPSNLNIIATMNTADQNVFVMDTAFKRRWEFEYIKVEFKDDHKFKDNAVTNIDITWKQFVEVINEFMMSEENKDLFISEDKQIGPYFVKENELNDPNKFGYKVLLYLWDDVFKMDKYKLFNKDIRTFSALISKFSKDDATNIFNPNFIKKLDEKKSEEVKVEEDKQDE